MKLYFLYLITSIFLSNNFKKVQNENTIVIPFKIVNDHMIANLKTDEGTLNLVFDIASNVSMIDSAKAKELDFQIGFNEPIKDIFTSFKNYSKGETLPKIHWLIKDFESESKRINYQIDGLLGAYSFIRMDNTEIDFSKNRIVIGADFNPSYNNHVSFDISTANKAVNGLGNFFPKFASIVDTVQFGSLISKGMDLIIDTGCKYGFAFICNDSTLIKRLLFNSDDYSLFNNNEKIGFTSAYVSKLSSNHYKAPLFYRPDNTEIMNNNFYGLVGIPVLKEIEKIYFDWSNNNIFFIKKN